ncbi:hypothetical protein [uncultured Tateyamaria sp.]|nr:hypothetical protein [uncultured Tateyamaria sp.]
MGADANGTEADTPRDSDMLAVHPDAQIFTPMAPVRITSTCLAWA